MNKFFKIGIIASICVIGIGMKFILFPANQSVQYLTTKVVKSDIQETVLATGTLEAFKQVSVGAQASGQVKSLNVSLGDEVKKGDLIAEIDSQSQENNLHIAEADLENVKAQLTAKKAELNLAESEYKRQKGMLGAKATSIQDYESALATLAETKAEIAALDAQIVAASIDVDTARVTLGYTSITAPMDGIVVAIVTKEGQTVNAAQATPTIVKLAQLDTMTVKAEVSEADVVKVYPGQKVYFTILGEPDHKYKATLRSIEPAPDSIEDEDSNDTTSSEDEAIYYNALFDVPNPDHKLRISMTVEATIILNEATNVCIIPEGALGAKDEQGRSSVQILSADGKPETLKVHTGLSDSVNIQIIDGLKEGDSVILGEADADSVIKEESNRPRQPMGL
ncbi:efflux RND transporter periplasmic adaptor subunit [Desulfovibrio gilichinskyi]|uniref:Membrane fusion protein, macrolide-specific efflux system n=1 Tax=Desulfovibrio gilichinskyi TaxID=1519643 RepID=A0A1X7EKJ3_9BACT|nr:efflux RND transporter periplasmic adaptor subunit [Desulfovibrio gilichinskyi]SMF35153.1 membrane fusion protein, macrolide-specific efflux system [Desulfovibrio gilichinskyi]